MNDNAWCIFFEANLVFALDRMCIERTVEIENIGIDLINLYLYL